MSLLFALFVSSSSAQVVPVAPFVGDYQEGWETQSGILNCHDVSTVGTICGISTGLLHITGGWSFTCSINPHSGGVLLGGGGGSNGHDFEFNTDVTQWGAYLATNAGTGADVTIEFYDATGALYDTVVEPVSNCIWQWYGYASPVPLSSVHVINSLQTGSYIMVDDVEVTELVCGPSDPDTDGDGFCDLIDACPGFDDSVDADGDGVADACDNCPSELNPGQADEDGDSYGAQCDCDDDNDQVNADAPELCDAVDNDCDGQTDEDPIDGMEFFADTDGDGHGDPNVSVFQCDPPDDYNFKDTDCDDTNADVHPDAPEVCDGIDNNCNGAVDEISGCEDETTTGDPKLGGCGCTSTPAVPGIWLALPALLALRRKR